MGDDQLRNETELPDAVTVAKKPRTRKTSPQSKPAKKRTTADPGATASPDPEQIETPAPPKRKKTTNGKKTKTGGTAKTDGAAKSKRTAKNGAAKIKGKKEAVEGQKKSLPNKQAELKIEPIKIEIEIIGSTGNEPPTGQAEVLKTAEIAKPAETVVRTIPASEPSNVAGAESGPIQAAVPLALAASAQVKADQVIALQSAAVKVRNIVATVRDLRTEIIVNKVIVQGILHEQVFYVGTDNLVHHLSDDSHFSTFLDIPGAQPGMNAQATAVVEDVIPELAPDGLSLEKKIILEIFVKVTESVQLNLAVGAGPVLLLNQVVGENTAQALIENDFTLTVPAIKIDEIVGSIRDLVYEIINGKVIIQGTLHKQIFFVDTANLERHQGEDVPFSLFVDLPGAAPGMDVTIHANIEAIFFNLTTATLLHQKAVLEIFVKVTERVQQPVTVGIGPLFKVEEFIAVNTAQHLSESLVTLAQPAVKIREIVASLRNLVPHVITDKVIIQGTIHKQIYFIGTDNIEHHQAEDVPFSLFLDLPGTEPGDTVRLDSRIEAVFFELLSDLTLRQKVILAITVTVGRETQLNLEVGTGILYKLDEVIGENTTQILLVRREVIPPPVPILPVVFSDPVVFPGGRVIGSQQTILQNTFPLAITAIDIKGIQATANDVTFAIGNEDVLVQGTLQSFISLIDTENIVQLVTESVPFTILVNVPGVALTQNLTAVVNVESIKATLAPDGTAVTQIAVLQAVVEANQEPLNPVNVVTNVTGPGITITSIQVEGFIQTGTGPVFQQFTAVTDVFGAGVKSVTKQLVPLKKVGDTKISILNVVTGVQFV